MVREIKIGILFIVVFAACLWGYKYIEGKNLLEDRKTIYAVYENVDQLTKAAPVKINGYQVGTVINISLNPDDVKSILVTMDVDGKIKYPKNAVASIKSAGVVSGKEIEISFDNLCTGSDCLGSGDYIKGQTLGLVESMIGTDDLGTYTNDIKNVVIGALDTLNSSLSMEKDGAPINETFQNIQKSMENVSNATASLERLLRNSQSSMTQTFQNLASLTNTLASSQGEIKTLITDLSSITAQLKNANMGETIGLTNQTLTSANDMIGGLSTTLSGVDSSFIMLNNMVEKLNSGDGMVSKLMNDPEMYNNLNDASKNMSLLLQDLRLNPKRYVRLSVFGRKGNVYTYPDEDPAFDEAPDLKND